MDPDNFKDYAKDMAEYITTYLENIRDRRVLPTVEPGYLKPLLPSEAPQTPEQWKDIMADIERVIMPGVSNRTRRMSRLCRITWTISLFELP
ncbi:hypothetical protein DMN91_011005 [Ooceraea biroi]|uniref:Aromatic-L-amino-acid decarboxylase n=1 Tax=Ooceraea biroi TaxID=2015173 RepID=A0A3L8D9D2_OOCBI|nr:hypothetical protein DMN91_011005 [Ooceraea biroi]